MSPKATEGIVSEGTAIEQFQEKCVAVFRPELRKNKGLERYRVSVKNGNALVLSTAAPTLPDRYAATLPTRGREDA